MTVTSRDLLMRVLADASTEEIAETVRAMVQQRVAEDHLVDFKDGALLSEPHCAATLREMVCGFANADGGTIVLGVSERATNGERTGRAQRFAACPANAGEIVARALAQVLSSRPIVKQLVVEGESVLVVAVPRSPTLISWWQANKSHCYLRIGESTHPVPEHLRLDLVLGRRERPALALTATSGTMAPTPSDFTVPTWLTISNGSLVWAEKVRVGVVGYGVSIVDPYASSPVSAHRAIGVPYRTLGSELRSRLSIPRSRTWHAVSSEMRPALQHVVVDVADLGPLDAVTQGVSIELPRCEGDYIWHGAVYVTAPAAGIAMYTISFRHRDHRFEISADDVAVCASVEHRPLVWWGAIDAWRDLDPDERALG